MWIPRPVCGWQAWRVSWCMNVRNCARHWKNALADRDIGIILLTEKFGREFPEIIDEVKLSHKLPLLIEIPDRHGTGRKPDFITSYINESIGLKL